MVNYFQGMKIYFQALVIYFQALKIILEGELACFISRDKKEVLGEQKFLFTNRTQY